MYENMEQWKTANDQFGAKLRKDTAALAEHCRQSLVFFLDKGNHQVGILNGLLDLATDGRYGRKKFFTWIEAIIPHKEISLKRGQGFGGKVKDAEYPTMNELESYLTDYPDWRKSPKPVEIYNPLTVLETALKRAVSAVKKAEKNGDEWNAKFFTEEQVRIEAAIEALKQSMAEQVEQQAA